MSTARVERLDPYVPAKPIQKAIFGVQEMVYYRPVQGEAKEVVPAREGYFTRVLDSVEQPYTRSYYIGEKWEALKLGWIADEGLDVAQLVILNLEGSFTQAIPTKEARDEAAKKVIEIGTHDIASGFILTFSKIPIQESARFMPHSWKQIRVRCLAGQCKITVAAIPE